jgi:hypothetical protein
LIARLFKAKYYPKCDFLYAKHSQNMSYSWQSIQKASWVLKKGCIWQIGNGENIKIWEDKWINPQPGSVTWSKKPENTTLQKVSDLIDVNSGGWKTQLISQTFYPMEATQICAIPLTNTQQEDLRCWLGTKDGIYSVKSGYQAIMEWTDNSISHSTSSNNSSYSKWKKLWSLAVPPKQIHLIWRILNNAIPVKENLLKRGIRCVPLCSYCNSKVESINHIFLECVRAKQVWFASPLTINIDNLEIKNIPDWIDYMIQVAKIEDMQKISTILYSIWNARNDKEFNGVNVPPEDISQSAPSSS